MDFHIFIYIAVLLLVALASTRLMKIIKLPNVTGYIITGIIMGPFVFGLLFNNFSFEGIKEAPIFQYVDKIKWVSTIALGFIAFSIGTSFKASVIKAVGKRVIVITILEALFASISWPFNLAKSIRSKSTKGKSLIFLILIDVGYVAGMLSKFFSTTFDWSSDWWIFMFYVINFIMVSADIVMYFINRNREKKEEGRIKDENNQ